MPNRAKLIRDYVLEGEAFAWWAVISLFPGVDAKGKWHDTAVQEVLPVEVLTVDDRMEHCEGVKPHVVREHEALSGIPEDWPEVIGAGAEPFQGKTL
ncbi:MAG: glutamine amidotransferase [Enterocloster bolteae]